MGSSLGWLLQLDGDIAQRLPQRAVGKGGDPDSSRKEPSRAQLAAETPTSRVPTDLTAPIRRGRRTEEPFARGSAWLPTTIVSIRNAIDILCLEVADKNTESNAVKSYPEHRDQRRQQGPLHAGRKVYEHRFYLLQGGFRAVTSTSRSRSSTSGSRCCRPTKSSVEVATTPRPARAEVARDCGAVEVLALVRHLGLDAARDGDESDGTSSCPARRRSPISRTGWKAMGARR